ncbi:MAG: c-type cytochrome biogenesis protein CcsB [Desulfobulbaceae bacterium]|nr:c-type cytochrome biogenesis protein CcsB [Desulfobulbaceae bacterium]MCK5341708.1 c-type cytochrome biogenesis protein CcsB [Desulfobulbaceae bacterium]
MNSSQLLGATTFLYLFASVLYAAIFIFRAQKLGIVATGVIVIGFLVQTAGIIMRWVESYQIGYGHAPLSNMYESLVFFSWAIVVFYLGLELKFKNRIIGAFAVPFAFLSMAYASFSTEFGQEIKPLVPALQSNWLIAHVVACFIGYAAFAVACGLGIMYLMKDRGKKGAAAVGKDEGLLGTLPDLKIIDDIIHKSLVFGFLWLSTGIITGAIWANSAWGTYWSWDPKETWSLITWFVYAVALHARFTKGWGGKWIAWLAILGFLAVLFTYYGVNFLLSGLHSYG